MPCRTELIEKEGDVQENEKNWLSKMLEVRKDGLGMTNMEVKIKRKKNKITIAATLF